MRVRLISTPALPSNWLVLCTSKQRRPADSVAVTHTRGPSLWPDGAPAHQSEQEIMRSSSAEACSWSPQALDSFHPSASEPQHLRHIQQPRLESQHPPAHPPAHDEFTSTSAAGAGGPPDREFNANRRINTDSVPNPRLKPASSIPTAEKPAPAFLLLLSSPPHA